MAVSQATLPEREGSGVVRTRRQRVLVVDDEMKLASIIAIVLESRYEVEWSSEPKHVLARIAQGERYDLVLSDLMMPEIDGVRLYQEIEKIDPMQASKVVFMSASPDRFAPFLRGRACVSKPFDQEQLLDFVWRELSQR